MDEFNCPTCGSDDVTGERQASGTITLTCESCRANWVRSPKPSCPRCGRGDVEEYGHEDWAYDDPAAAKKAGEGPGQRLGGRTLRCRRCHHTWGQAR